VDPTSEGPIPILVAAFWGGDHRTKRRGALILPHAYVEHDLLVLGDNNDNPLRTEEPGTIQYTQPLDRLILAPGDGKNVCTRRCDGSGCTEAMARLCLGVLSAQSLFTSKEQIEFGSGRFRYNSLKEAFALASMTL
jgi:hypothetical protein